MAHRKRLQPVWLALALAVGVSLMWAQFAARAQSLACSPSYLIDVTLNTGARWQMCWETRQAEGIVFHNITYSAPGQPARMVLAQANLAQLHVPYDDNGARFHDLSDYGMGGFNLNDLTPSDCPNGTLIRENTKDVLCQHIGPAGYLYKYYSAQAQSHVLTLFAVSHIGEYNYITQWRFYDNGVIEPAVGATGRLQRFSGNPAYGWPLDSANAVYGVSHMHTYYWRLDFDLSGTHTDDVVEEINFTPNGAQDQFTLGQTVLLTETARAVSPGTFRSWRVKDTVTNADGHAISYHLEADPAHLFHGPSYEPFTQNEVYVTVNNVCEQFVSHNPTSGGCGNNVTEFVNNQSLAGADVVLWYGLSFHHLPRDEDQNYMFVHWSNFVIAPRDWTALNPLVGVSTITPTPTGTLFTATPNLTRTSTSTVTPTRTMTPTLTPTTGGVFLPILER